MISRNHTLSLVVTLLLACGSSSSPSGVAGKVVEIEGQVSATRGDESPRALELGDQVFANDVVKTTKGSEVTILLDKNGVPLRLADGAETQVAKSAAWQAPKSREGDRFAGKVNDPSTAAGRSGNRAAGDDPRTAMPNAKQEKPDTAETTAAAVAANPGSGQNDTDNETRDSKMGTGGLGLDGIGAIGGGAGQSGGGKGDNDSGGKVARNNDEQPVDDDQGVTAKVAEIQPSKNGKLQLRKVTPDANRKALRNFVRQRAYSVGTCLHREKATGALKFTVTFKIGEKGAVADLEVDGISNDKHKACVTRALGRAFPAKLAGSSVSIAGDYR